MQVLNGSVVAFLVHQGFKTAALTLQEEAGDNCTLPTPSPSGPLGSSGHMRSASVSSFAAMAGKESMGADAGLALWRWWRLSRSSTGRAALQELSAEAQSHAAARDTAAAALQELEATKAALATAHAEAAAAQAHAASAVQQAVDLKNRLEAVLGEPVAMPILAAHKLGEASHREPVGLLSYSRWVLPLGMVDDGWWAGFARCA